MNLSLLLQQHRAGWIGAIGGIFLVTYPTTTLAQIAGDGTVGTQVNGSLTAPCTGACLINGGTERGVNLYHSFREFSIPTGGQVWFNNSPQIQNILTRVTGSSISNIDGLLKANGTANLFFLNPNGIIFGPNARLQIGGSFLASTASSFKFPDGSEFSATNPQAPPLLTVNITPGLQTGTIATGSTLTNRGNLTAGQDLILEADHLDLQGNLVAGRDLTLKAQNTVQIRDTVTTPFVAQSGTDLTIQGNQSIDILALNHLDQIPFVSGGALTLISDGTISGDAHFASQGFFLLKRNGQPGDFVSLFDPVIQANGDVVFGNYTGVSLKVEATGSIQGGSIFITGPDLTIPVGDPDVGGLTSTPAVILRAGLPFVAAPNLTQTTGGANFTPGVAAAGQPPGSILVGGIDTSDNNGLPGGVIQLRAPGTITTGYLNASSFSDVGSAADGGSISVTAGGDLTINGVVNASSRSTNLDSGNGGTIRLTSTTGNIITESELFTSTSGTGNAGNGGTITVTANGNISIGGGGVLSDSFSDLGTAGDGGDIVLTATRGKITMFESIYSSTISLSAGSGTAGNVTLTTTGDITLDNIFASTQGVTTAGNGGTVTLTTIGDILPAGKLETTAEAFGPNSTAGRGGAIALTSTTGNITVNQNLSSYSYADGNSSDGGAITLSTGTGNITTSNADLRSFSASASGNSATGGAITVTTQRGTINLGGDLDSDAYAGQGNAGTGGHILVSAPNGQVISNPQTRLTSYSVSEAGNSGNGGNVRVEAQDRITQLEILTLSSTAQSGSVELVGLGNLAIANLQVLTSKQLSLQFCRTCTPLLLTVGEQGKSGNVSISSVGDLTLSDSRIDSDAKGSEPAGNIAIASGGWITLTNSQFTSNTSSTGQAGNIAVTAQQGLILSGASTLSAATRAQGNAGNIAITTPQLMVNQGAQIVSTTTGTGQAGNIQIQTTGTTISGNRSGIISDSGTPTQRGGNQGNGGTIRINTDTLHLENNGIISTSTFTQGQSGNIEVTARTVNLLTGGNLSATTQNAGNAGNIQVNASDHVLITGDQSAFLVSTTPEASGNGGNVTINTGNLDIRDRGKISADSQGSGRGGDVAIASGGWITLTNSQLTSNTSSTGQAGNITATATQGMILSGSDTRLAAETSDRGNAGNIAINTPQLMVNQGAQIASTTTGSGQAGNIQIRTADTTISGNGSGIISGSGTPDQRGGNRGAGGNISLFTETLKLDEKGIISTSTFTQGQSGSIDVTAGTVALVNGGKLSATTQNAGNAGNIRVNASDQVLITGDQSAFLVITTPEASGNGGNVTVNTGTLDIRDRGKISADSQGSGQGGNVAIGANQITLKNQGQIIAETATNNGGNINLQVRDLLLLRNNSLISASAGTAQSGGNGGNVTIKAGFVVASLSENSDIRANAFTGKGGSVNITAKGIFGLKSQPKDTPFSDITASSSFGISGTVTLTTINVDPNRGSVQLPAKFTDTTNQIAQTCSSRSQGNSFILTGRGGVALDPGEVLSQAAVWQEQVDQRRATGETRAIFPGLQHLRKLAPSNPLIEAATWQWNADGSISFVAAGVGSAPAIATVTCTPTITPEQR